MFQILSAIMSFIGVFFSLSLFIFLLIKNNEVFGNFPLFIDGLLHVEKFNIKLEEVL